jgi:hypothetical protein
MPHALFDDEVYLRARESEEHVEARRFVEKDGLFNAECERAFVACHIDDMGRPVELRTMDLGKRDVMFRQIERGIRHVWTNAFEDTVHKYNVSYLMDDFVLHFLLRKCATKAGEGMKTLEGWVAFVKDVFVEAGVMRMAVLCEHHQQYLDRTKGERDRAGREAELRRMKEEEETFEKWLAGEEARLNKLKLDKKLDEYQLKTVEKKAKVKEFEKKKEQNDDRRRELRKEDEDKVQVEKERVEAERAERIKKEEEEQKLEQEEMNRLAETDEEEYNLRLEANAKKQAEMLEKAKEPEGSKRRRGARERKESRRNDRLLVDLPTLLEYRKVVLG